MLIYDVLRVCFVALLAPNLVTNAKLDSKTIKPEALFADVIKNISRVNNELQNLINNYEQFKRTHVSQENFDDNKEYLSDEEGGRINRNSKNYENKPTDKTTTHSNPTEMIYEEEEADQNSGVKISSEVEKSSQVQPNSEIEQSHEEESKKPTENTDQKKEKVQITTTETSVTNVEPTDEPLRNGEIGPKSEDFVNIHENMKIKTDRLKRILLEAYQDPNNTKYIENDKNTKYLEGIPPQPSESDISADGERHTAAKEEEVTTKKLQERVFNETQGGSTTGIYLRSELKKEEETTTTTEKFHNESLESIDIDEDLSKDVFKTNVLRQAYGDACLKLVIRKCHKACKSASVFSCRGAIKCKSEFKNYYKNVAKTGCLNAFNVSSLRRTPGPISIDGDTMTGEGYLSVACQSPTRRNLEEPNPIKNQTESLNILRDKYERACTKASQKKCINACHYAVKESCAKFECKKRLNKNFNKNCKSACKKFYYSKSKKSKSSGSDSDSDGSDEDSDDDSNTDSSEDGSSSSKDKTKL